jgi:twitching motility two-component system response regulator PilH
VTRILIVDDSPTEVHVLKSMLEKSGYQVVTALSGEEGIKAAQAHKPELILMDVVMPGINGFQATRELSTSPETAHIPVIIVTTKDQQTDKVWASRQGAKDYIVKPVKENELLNSVKSHLAKRS